MRILIVLIIASIIGVPFGLMSYVTLRDEVLHATACGASR